MWIINKSHTVFKCSTVADPDSQPLFPTPPCSGRKEMETVAPSDLGSQRTLTDNLEHHTEFLHHAIKVQLALKTFNSFSSERFCSSVLRTSLMHSLDILSQQLGYRDLNWTVQNHCLKCICTLVDVVKDDTRKILLEKLQDLCNCLCNKILDNHTSIEVRKLFQWT